MIALKLELFENAANANGFVQAGKSVTCCP
jgi:hypothetical protein